MNKPWVFISYHPNDAAKKDELLSQLSVIKHSTSIEMWSKANILPGQNWKQEIHQAAYKAQVAILLISKHFFDSENVPLQEEISLLRERHKHEGLTIIPVIASACPWQNIGWLEKIEVRPKDKKPLWRKDGDVNHELSAIAQEIKKLIEEIIAEGESKEPLERLQNALDAEVGTIRNNLNSLDILIAEIEKQAEQQKSQRKDRNLFSNFWKIRDDEPPPYCIISALKPVNTGKYKRLTTGFGEIKGFASIVYSLSRAFERSSNISLKDTNLYFGEKKFQTHNLFGRSLILLGGDDVNHGTKRVLLRFRSKKHTPFPKFKLPFKFRYEDGGIKWLSVEDPRNPIECKPTYYEDSDDVEFDYGVVARLPNPFAPNRTSYIFAGCHTYGTTAAAKVVAARSILKQIENSCESYKDSEYFVLVIRCEVTNENEININLIRIFIPFNKNLEQEGRIERDVDIDRED